MPRILGIETSCDETAAAIVACDYERSKRESAMSVRSTVPCESKQAFTGTNKQILSNVISSHIKEHQPYGGVVPEISSRAHLRLIREVVEKAFADANMAYDDIDAIAVTAGPGLIGGVIVGVMTAKAMAMALNKPIIAVNHLEGHALTVRLTEDVTYPYLLFLASGGHCQFLAVHGLGQYTLLGQTLDDALGECYDKVAKMLGLPYPGGPEVEARAKLGTIDERLFPIPMAGRKGADMSFSGLKTAVRQYIQALGTPSEQKIADICASFQWAAAQSVVEKLGAAINTYEDTRSAVSKPHESSTREAASHVRGVAEHGDKTIVFAGGVAANQYLRGRIEEVCAVNGYSLHVPPIALCTDNAAMIAWAGMEYFLSGKVDSLEFEPKANWPLSS